MAEATTEPPADRQPLYYTFGNHMHWVDMEWLWGYHVLPGLGARHAALLRGETGAKGNVNFDGVGYEKMAAEAPEALAELREAVAARRDRSRSARRYGQPYGLFHGGESNVRQRVYGARAVRRLLGVRPRTFWEEEFDFFPQLPQMLRGVGYRVRLALLPVDLAHPRRAPRRRCRPSGGKGSTAAGCWPRTRNALNLHQWPEDFDGLLESPAAARDADAPASCSGWSSCPRPTGCAARS